MRGTDRKIERSVRRYFEESARAVITPEPPPIPPGSRAGGPGPFLRDLAIQAGVAVVCVSLTILFVKDLHRQTPLRLAIERFSIEQTYRRYLPDEQSLRALIEDYFSRRSTQ